ncbi:hypothetical protein [Microbacterium aurum]|uniref:serine O-acetyltransferase n=1 Tax=Microbacterium aurum TaxID=36805 RepID=UPI0028EFCDA6|nr:hypothetical protein [Microbacterium aurum]
MDEFSTDLAKLSAALLGVEFVGFRSRLALWLLNSELHCVAAYRFGRFADEWRARNGFIGIPLVVMHRIWNRWNTHIHHCDISRGANIGPGFLLMHRFGVIIGPTDIGANAVIHHNVTIGQRVAHGDQGMPRIGEAVWIGPGAIITGAIKIGDGATIAAGAVVSRDVPARSLVAGNPGRVIAQEYDNSAMINFELATGARMAE